ncbi:PAS domain-containing hybrid sensor histidine kinase/response regulator [Sphingomonas glacialis]|uniref:PAS domain-containing hybrid sensor histidine kinase/response regulator n=1 Tax=Sphingomonas glacialis TaxID=658225 RepID=UPI001F501231|nr:PAS domain-containing hybrid sensor histidine kinase/response regulator [Sphingomonas glacialis]
MTKQHLAAASLAESERHCRMLADNVRDIIAVYDADGFLRYVSPSITNLLGYAPEEMLGKTPFMFMHSDDHARVAREFKAAATSPVDVTVEYRALAKNGDVRWFEAKPRFHRDASNAIVEISDSVRDVTDRRLREAALQQARLDAENASAAKATFLANMSHEIRTPMNAVFGFAELLARMDLTEEQRKYLQLIADSGRAMMRLLNDILDMSKIDSGRMQVAAEPVRLGHKLHVCAQLMEPIARSKGVDLTISLDPALPEYVVGDPLRIRQILLNLIGNAVKFTDHGAISVHARARHGVLSIDVEDSGIGIAPDRLDMIFQQFAQADASVARRYGGTGLGLSISAELARLMGGSIDVVSAVGVGTTFTLRIPLVEATTHGQPDRAVAQGPTPSSTRHAAPLRVLIAEDHAVNRALITAMADAAGFIHQIAADGAEAVAMVQAAAVADVPFDLVLMDMQMPVVDGLTATRRIRALGFTAERLPIVALTANAYAEDKAACLAAGMQAHLAKPVRLRDLEALAERFSGNRALQHDIAAGAEKGAAAKDVAVLYRKGKATTLAAISASAHQESIDRMRVQELTAMLHDLAGMAGFFGETLLGDAASELEQDLKRAPACEWPRLLKAGCDRLAHVA